MSAETKIEWCDSTFNPVIGCNGISPGCDDCYAARSTPARVHGIKWGAGQPRRRTAKANWKLPERWDREPFVECRTCGWRGTRSHSIATEIGQCFECGEPHKPARRRVFCASLADWLDNEWPIEWLVDLLGLIRRTPNLDWLLLTKRIGNWRSRLEAAADATVGRQMALNQWITQWLYARTPPPNVWLGATVINQVEADRDLPKLLAVPARVRFLSIEPMLGTIDLTRIPVGGGAGRWEGDEIITANVMKRADAAMPRLHWIIAGGESGPHARPSHPDWYRSLRDQCEAAGVPFLFKQWGEWGPADDIEAYGRARHGWWEAAPEDGGAPRHEWPDGQVIQGLELLSTRTESFRVGKKVAGRLLDGIEHNAFPIQQ